MLKRTCGAGFTLVETMIALALLLGGIAGATLLLLQSLQHEHESSNRRSALRFAGSLAEELRARRRNDSEPLSPDAPEIAAWSAEVAASLPAGASARVDIEGSRPARYRIEIEWPVAGQGVQRLRVPVAT